MQDINLLARRSQTTTVSPVRVYEEYQTNQANKVTKGYEPIKRVNVQSDFFGNVVGNGINKAKKDVFSKLEEQIRNMGGNVGVVVSRNLSGVTSAQLKVVADVYRIYPFPYS